MYKNKRVSVVIPALNEALSITYVIEDLLALRNEARNQLIDEIVICDNGSTDNTNKIARALGTTVVSEQTPGYGRACLKAIDKMSASDIVLFIDADHAFYAHQAIPLIESIHQGADLAIGSRTLGTMKRGALSQTQIFGNKLASNLIKLIWQHAVSDLGPFRAISNRALKKLDMQDKTFGWTIEMQIKAIQTSMTIVELPVDTRCRIGKSKISGTIKGSIGAGIGILSMIAKLWWSDASFRAEKKQRFDRSFDTQSLRAIPVRNTQRSRDYL